MSLELDTGYVTLAFMPTPEQICKVLNAMASVIENADPAVTTPAVRQHQLHAAICLRQCADEACRFKPASVA